MMTSKIKIFSSLVVVGCTGVYYHVSDGCINLTVNLSVWE